MSRNNAIKDQILVEMLHDVPFDGWTWQVAQTSIHRTTLDPLILEAVFPNKIEDILRHFSDWADRQMMNALISNTEEDTMRIRDRIHHAVMTRFEVLYPHKEATRAALSYWMIPHRKPIAAKLLWQTASRIWDWAGDTATDYNYYTKRGLLTGILASTAYVWLNDQSDHHTQTREFLTRRINNVLTIGKATGKVAGKFSPLLSLLPFHRKQRA